MRLPRLAPVLAAAAALITPAHAFAWETVARVTMVEGGAVPDYLFLKVDAPAGPCAAGQFLRWRERGVDSAMKQRNVEAAYALLLTAKTTGQTIRISGDEGSCEAAWLYLGQ